MTDVGSFIGIDFGTTNSSMAWFDPDSNQAEVIFNAEGEYKTLSLVYFGEDEILVGKPVEELLEESEGYDPREREDIARRVVKSIKRNLISPPVIPIPGRKPVRPVEVVSEILKKLKRDAEEGYFHEVVEQAVITCPAVFSPSEWNVLFNAAIKAGFTRVERLEEPTAAALTVAHEGRRIGNDLLVYDLGAGTFDLSVLSRDEEGNFYAPIEPRGDPHCGGDDFDLALYYYWDEVAQQKLGRPISLAEGIDLVFLRQCRKRKENLTSQRRSKFSSFLASSNGVTRFSPEIDRDTFEGLIREQVERTVGETDGMLKAAKERGHQVQTIVLIGGSSRVPLVERLLENTLPLEPHQFGQKDYAVALGAAYRGQELWGEEQEPNAEEYRRDLEICWQDRKLTRTEAEWLKDLAERELELSPKTATRVEREVMGGTITELLERQERTARDHYGELLKLGFKDNRLDALRSIPPARLEMLLDNRELFIGHDFADAPVSAQERTELVGDAPWGDFVMAARVATDRSLAPAAVEERLRNSADRFGLSEEQAAEVEREVLGSTVAEFIAQESQSLAATPDEEVGAIAREDTTLYAQPEREKGSEEAPGSGSLPPVAGIQEICSSYASDAGYGYFVGRIHGPLLESVRFHFGIPTTDRVVALLVRQFSAVENEIPSGLAICTSGLYWGNSVITTKKNSMLWDEFARASVRNEPFVIRIASDHLLETSGLSLPSEGLVELLQELQSLARSAPKWSEVAHAQRVSRTLAESLDQVPQEDTRQRITPSNANRVRHFRTLVKDEGTLSVAFSPDGELLASTTRGGVHLWRVASATYIDTLKVDGGPVAASVAFSPDGELLALGLGNSNSSLDNNILLWRVRDSTILHTLQGHEAVVTSLAFSPDGQMLASSGSNDRKVNLWRSEDGAFLRTLAVHQNVANEAAFSPDGRQLASAGGQSKLMLLRTSGGELLEGDVLRSLEGHQTPNGQPGSILSVAFSPDGELIASAGTDNMVMLWQTEDGTILHRLEGHTGLVESVAFSPDGRLVCSGGRDHKIILWRVEDGAQLCSVGMHADTVVHVAFSPGGELIASGSTDGDVFLYRPETDEVERKRKALVAEVRRICTKYKDRANFWVGDQIPADKLGNARVSYPIPKSESVIALADTTWLSGNAKQGLAVGENGIYWHNKSDTPTRRSRLFWDQLKDISAIKPEGVNNIELGKGNKFVQRGNGLSRDEMITMLSEIQTTVRRALR